MERRSLTVANQASGLVPEEIIVFEVAVPLSQFASAARAAGLEWLAEFDEEFQPDEDFFKEGDPDGERGAITGHLYVSVADQAALRQVRSLWTRWSQGLPLHRGTRSWGNIFEMLRDVRSWGVQDRLREEHFLGDWQERVTAQQETVRCELELWHRQSSNARDRALASVADAVLARGGTVIGQSIVPEIGYGAVLAELPISVVDDFLNRREVHILQCREVQFIMGAGQMMADPVDARDDIQDGPTIVASVGPSSADPVAALLDGVPLENHPVLANQLSVHDSHDWASSCPAVARRHGTAMASLIVAGDLDGADSQESRSLVVYPILKAEQDFHGQWIESVPDDQLIVDRVRTAVERLLGTGTGPSGLAPKVNIINLSVGDRHRPFDGRLSPLARLLDWLAVRYGVLFVVSAGNASSVELGMSFEEFRRLDMSDRTRHVLVQALEGATSRRILSPAEALNVLTVGATHSDASDGGEFGSLADPCTTGFPSPYNRLGLGFGRAIKPEILQSGGRALLRQDRPGSTEAVFANTLRAPGHRVASPGGGARGPTSTTWSRGTSNATALTTRAAVRLFGVLEDLRSQTSDAILDSVPTALWLKALLVHACAWGDLYEHVDAIARTDANSRKFREHASRVLGYGVPNLDRVIQCTENRATLLTGGSLAADQRHDHRVPLPSSLSEKTGLRRVIVTLVWFTPVNPRSARWRSGRLNLVLPPAKSEANLLRVHRTEADYNAVQRGTVQHEILEGKDAVPLASDSELLLPVVCRSDAGALEAPMAYALAVTIEVAPELGVPVYDEVRAKIRQRVSVRPRG